MAATQWPKGELATELEATRGERKELKGGMVSTETARAGLAIFTKGYEEATPEQRKRLSQLMVDEATYGEDSIKMALYKVALDTGPLVPSGVGTVGSNHWPRWHAGQDSNLGPQD